MDGVDADPALTIELSMDELREVVRYAVGNAEVVLPVLERVASDDPRPRAAIHAARAFAQGAARSNLQRSTATAAHRAAKEAGSSAARHAAMAAGDAAASAYLHPLARATQVGHILRSAAHAAMAVELAGGDPAGATIEAAARRAGPVVVAVLRRYPPAPGGGNQVAVLMSRLDAILRSR